MSQREDTVLRYHRDLGLTRGLNMYKVLKGLMWWTDMEIGIKNIIKNCKVCNKFDNKPNPSKISYPIPDPEPFEVWAIDIIGPLP